MKRCIAWAVLLALPAVLFLVVDAAGQQAKSGGTLRVAWEQDVTGFDPHWTSGLQVTYIAGNLFNNLVTIDQDLNYVPELAESWESQENGKVYEHVKGYMFERGFKIRFETTWLEKP